MGNIATMNRKFEIILVILMMAVIPFSADAGNGGGRISILDYEISRVIPSGLHDVSGAVKFNVQNGRREMAVTSATGVLYHKGNTFGTFTIDPFTIQGKCTSWVEVSGDFHLDDNVGLASILRMVTDFDLDEFTVDYDIRAKSGIFRKTFKKKNLSIRQLIQGTKK